MNITRYNYRPAVWFDDLLDPLSTVSRWAGDREERDIFPRLQGWVKPDEVVIQAELPGVDPDKIEINLQAKTLTLSGNREIEAPFKDGEVALNERVSGAFKRSVELPYDVESVKIKATHKHGVLTIHLPRAESQKPRKIQIEAA